MKVDETIRELKKIISLKEGENNYEVALLAAETLSEINYEYNQIYTDKELEDELLIIRDKILNKKEYNLDQRCVFFYDGFGLDLRGLAAIYARALTSLNYNIIYACPNTSQGRIPHILSEFRPDKTDIVYIDKSISNIDRIKQINAIFEKYRPKAAFFYTYPSDVEAAIAFSNNESTTRFQIDLTDHAFWIGVNAFDYIIDGRDMGASIAHYGRKIPKNRIIKLDCAPYINKDVCDIPFPFDLKTEKYIFTGGALYKTLGDPNLLYYKTIDDILRTFLDIKFIYAGSGDDTEIQKIVSKYEGRAFLIDERSDFYELIKHSILYLNSYPMFGGLMMRYAALARRIPITLKHDNDSDGILINQEQLDIEYDNYDDFITEIHKLISDDNYRKQKEKRLVGSVMTEDDFVRNLSLLIEKYRTEYSFDEMNEFDTTEFRNEYKRRYTTSCLYQNIAKKANIRLFKYFPKEFIFGTIIKIKEKLRK